MAGLDMLNNRKALAIATAGVLTLAGALLVNTQAGPRVLTRADFGTPTQVVLPKPTTTGNGDWAYGRGLEIHKWPDGAYYLVSSSWNPQTLLRYRLPASLSGTATFVNNMGEMGQEGVIFGLFFDEATQRYCAHSHVEYDTDARQMPTLTCVPLEAATGKLKTRTNAAGATVPDFQKWVFADASKPCLARVPSATELATNVITFASVHGFTRGAHVIAANTEGGLTRGVLYFAYPKSTTTITLHKTYTDGYNGTAPIDLTAPITGTLTSCTPRGDRATGGGSARVPEALVATFGGHYAAGFGGVDSVITSGNISMGPTACGYELPAQSFIGFVMCKPLVGYTYSANAGMGETFANRDPGYAQTFHWDSNPEKGSDALAQYGAGKWTPGDFQGQTGAFIDLGYAAGFVTLADHQVGCIWYGDNYHGLWPTLREGAPIVPVSTDLASGTVQFPSSVVWPTGTMVQLATSEAGLTGGNFNVYWVRQVAPSAYAFYRNLDEANGAPGLVPTSTDITNTTAGNRVMFVNPHGLRTQEKVRIATAGGGLEAAEYWVNAAYPTSLTFHVTRDDAAGTIIGQAKNPVDLTAPITSLIITPAIKPTAAITTGVRLVSYCARSSGTKAALNAQGARHTLYIYRFADLVDVAEGSKTPQSAIQPASVDAFEIPGVTYPYPGLPGMTRQSTGAMWVPGLARYVISLRHTGGGQRSATFYPITAEPPPPPKPGDLTLEEK